MFKKLLFLMACFLLLSVLTACVADGAYNVQCTVSEIGAETPTQEVKYVTRLTFNENTDPMAWCTDTFNGFGSSHHILRARLISPSGEILQEVTPPTLEE